MAKFFQADQANSLTDGWMKKTVRAVGRMIILREGRLLALYRLAFMASIYETPLVPFRAAPPQFS